MQSNSDHTKKLWVNKMPPHSYIKLLRQNLYYVKIFFLVSFVGLTLPLIWIQYAIKLNRSHIIVNEIQNSHKNDKLDHMYKNFGKKAKLSKDIKYILVWTKSYRTPIKLFAAGRKMFLKNNCSVNKCYVTRNRTYFQSNLTRFDAIGFVGQDLNSSDLPGVRSLHQKYIYFNTESADNYPTCDPQYDGFFNWTSTYRLDSDIPYPYILIRDKNGKIVGPKPKMRWKENMAAVGDEFYDRIANRTKAAALFVSNCRSLGRLQFVRELKHILLLYGLTVDVYGECGTLKCPKELTSECDQMLERDYFFYMSMENSFAEDYVTEKLLRALQHNVVPIVYGGADYSRFLPPGSYINARKIKVVELAAMMNKLINYPKQYLQYFRWKNHYTYHDPTRLENVCALCKALHDQEKLKKTTVYYKFRSWWNPNYKKRCLRFIQRRYRNVTTRLNNATKQSCC